MLWVVPLMSTSRGWPLRVEDVSIVSVNDLPENVKAALADQLALWGEGLMGRGAWATGDFLERYYVLGSTDSDIVVVPNEVMIDLLNRAVALGRFKDAPVHPAMLAG